MNLGDLGAYFTGYVRIRVTGPAVERFVNLAASRGHRVWRTRRRPRSLEANVSLPSFRRLRPIARRTRSRVRILERRGLPFALGRARRRPLMVGGALLSLAVLYVLSSLVWFVDIEGAEEFDPDLLREVVASLGLRPGVFKNSVDAREVERGLILAVNGLSWAAVEIHGTVAVVRVAEKDPLEMPNIPLPPADIVAAKDGVIVTLIVLAGQAVVKEGDTVKAGDLLIRGSQPIAAPTAPARPGEKPPPPPEKEVVASGLVRARVWHQTYAEVPLHSLSHQPTGRTWRRVHAVVAGHLVPLYGWWAAPVGLYERYSSRLDIPFWRNVGVPIEFVTTVFTEVRDVQTDLTPEEAEALARDAAFALLAKQFPRGLDPSACHFEVTTKNDILIGVLATTEAVEDIAQVKERR